MRLALLYFAMILLTLCLHVLLRSDYRRRIRRLCAVAAGTGDTVSATPFLSVFFPALSALLLCITGIGVLAASPFLSPARLTAVFFVAYATALLCWLPALLTRYGIRQIWMVCPDRLYHPASGEMHHLYEVTFCRLSTHRRYTSFSLLADGDTLRFRLPTGTHADDFLSSLTCPEMTRRTLVRSALPERLLSVLSVLLLILGVLQCTLPFFLPQSITDYRDQTDKGADPTVQYQTPVTLAGPIVFLRGGNTVYVFSPSQMALNAYTPEGEFLYALRTPRNSFSQGQICYSGDLLYIWGGDKHLYVYRGGVFFNRLDAPFELPERRVDASAEYTDESGVTWYSRWDTVHCGDRILTDAPLFLSAMQRPELGVVLLAAGILLLLVHRFITIPLADRRFRASHA